MKMLIKSLNKLQTVYYENTPIDIQRFFTAVKMRISVVVFFYYFHMFAQNRYCGYMEAVLTRTHNICFRAKIKK